MPPVLAAWHSCATVLQVCVESAVLEPLAHTQAVHSQSSLRHLRLRALATRQFWLQRLRAEGAREPLPPLLLPLVPSKLPLLESLVVETDPRSSGNGRLLELIPGALRGLERLTRLELTNAEPVGELACPGGALRGSGRDHMSVHAP